MAPVINIILTEKPMLSFIYKKVILISLISQIARIMAHQIAFSTTDNGSLGNTSRYSLHYRCNFNWSTWTMQEQKQLLMLHQLELLALHYYFIIVLLTVVWVILLRLFHQLQKQQNLILK